VEQRVRLLGVQPDEVADELAEQQRAFAGLRCTRTTGCSVSKTVERNSSR